MIEEPLQFGEGGRLFGILTLPDERPQDADELPVFVFLTSGLLHRIGPRRLYVRLARELAEMGFTSLRIDMAGRGDSLPSRGLDERESAAKDFRDIVSILESRLGPSRFVVGGLCSAADDAIGLAPNDERIIGMLLLDPVCERDDGYRTRQLMEKYTNPARYVLWLKRRIRKEPTSNKPDGEPRVDYLALRHFPPPKDLRAAFQTVCARKGRVLSVFTSYAHEYLNQDGQLGRVLGVDGYDEHCTELFWPGAEHSYTLEHHRARLIDEVKAWAASFKLARLSTPK